MSGPVARARSLLSRPGAWIEARDGRYDLRLGPDRRARVTLNIDEAAFRALIETPGLAMRRGGGWIARATGPSTSACAAGRAGVIEGEKTVIEPDGSLTSRRANLGESPVAWLARRRDSSGRPWLTPAELAAGERLRRDAELAGSGPSLTMRWDALPRSGGGSSARVEPGDLAMTAARRVAAALDACGPRLRGPVEAICVRGSSLQLAEQEHGLRRRQGKTALKQGLQALAEHYGIG